MRKIGVRVFFLTLSFVLLLFFCGCATTALHKSIESYAEVRNEFSDEICRSGFIKGSYSGTVQIGETKYSNHQFSDVLSESSIAHNRLLEILLPEQSSEKVLIRSSYKRQNEISPAHLMCYDQVVRSRQMIADFDKSNMGNAVHTMFFEVLPSEVVVYRVWLQNQDTGEVMRTKVASDTQIDWHIRSRTIYALMHGGYIFTIPADILGTPFYVLLMSISAIFVH